MSAKTATLDDRRVLLAGCFAQVEMLRRVPLTAWERHELDVVALASGRPRRQADRARARQAELAPLAARVGHLRESSLIASMGAPGANVQPWHGPLGFEGEETGDGRVITAGALAAARMPLPLRWAPIDNGGHDGAQLVGRIDAIERRDGGVIWGAGVLDLGSELGRECARLIAAGMLGGVSLDLDSTATAPGQLSDGTEGALVNSGRVRAATIVAIPAFEGARIQLDGQPRADLAPGLYSAAPDPHGEGEDCGCSELSTAGPATFTTTTTTPPSGVRRPAQHQGSTK